MHSLQQLRSGALAGVSRLDLSEHLSEFPREIFDLADSLEVLNLSANQLTTLPDDLPRLRKLKIIFCSDNPFTQLPEVLGQCPALEMIGFKSCNIQQVPAHALPAKLRWLVLTDNQLQRLPDALGQCTALQKLMLAGNQLNQLPDSMSELGQLELLRLAANNFSALPDWLFKLPRLAWLALAGNPICAQPEAQASRSLRSIARSEFEFGRLLGQGASGMIYAASSAANPHLAVKLFKGQMTSDGLPSSEMAATLAAGQHPQLINLLGPLEAQAGQPDGLVMQQIESRFSPLAGPPSLISCTRDIYAEAFTISAAQVLEIAQRLASVLAHLHQRGIMHGDFYGHNILRNQQQLYLSDFGAASLFEPGSALANACARLDIRAFGILLEELLEHCEQPQPTLYQIAKRCQSANTASRPSAHELLTLLELNA